MRRRIIVQNAERKYELVVNKKRIEVTELVYKEYYKLREHEVYLCKKSARYDISIEACVDRGVQIDYLIASTQEPIDELVIRNEMISKIIALLPQLNLAERNLINELFFMDKSEHQLSRETGIPQKTINDRKRRVLTKLRILFEK